MGISAFEELDSSAGSFNINEAFFASDITFPLIPNSTVQVIQVQVETDQASLLQVTTDGQTTWVNINNATAVDGLATFTMVVPQGAELNFRNTDVAGLAVKILVAA